MDDVAKVIELWTGIPAVKIRETEFVKLAGLEAALKQKAVSYTHLDVYKRQVHGGAEPLLCLRRGRPAGAFLVFEHLRRGRALCSADAGLLYTST